MRIELLVNSHPPPVGGSPSGGILQTPSPPLLACLPVLWLPTCSQVPPTEVSHGCAVGLCQASGFVTFANGQRRELAPRHRPHTAKQTK